jgi:hypothetical protein
MTQSHISVCAQGKNDPPHLSGLRTCLWLSTLSAFLHFGSGWFVFLTQCCLLAPRLYVSCLKFSCTCSSAVPTGSLHASCFLFLLEFKFQDLFSHDGPLRFYPYWPNLVDRTRLLPFRLPPWRKSHSKYSLLLLLRHFLFGWLTVQCFHWLPFLVSQTELDETFHVMRGTSKGLRLEMDHRETQTLEGKRHQREEIGKHALH